jgi:hypothetical protein
MLRQPFLLVTILLSLSLLIPWKLARGQNAISMPGSGEQDHQRYLPLIVRPKEWVKLDSNLPVDWIRDITINPSTPHELLVALRDNGIFKSGDRGRTWRAVYSFGQTNSPSARIIAFAPSNPNIVYAGIINNVIRSDDRGETWRSVWPSSIPGGGWGLAVDPVDFNHVFVGINSEIPYNIYETIDGGQNWIPKNLIIGDQEGIISLAISPVNPDQIFAGANTDVATNPRITRLYKSMDGGDAWATVHNGFPNTKRVTSLNYNICSPGQLFVTRQRHGPVDDNIRWTNDAGLTWHTVPFYDDDLGISPLFPCPIFTAMQRSRDNGLTWENISFNFYNLMPDPENVRFTSWAPDPWTNTLWVGTRDHGLFYIGGLVPSR